MKFVRKLLFPVVPIYYFISWLRNLFFDIGFVKSQTYNLPLICVGNLSTGGTGKSPMIEYLIRLLKPKFKIATLSRGYKRSTEGFLIADESSTSSTIGDEPFQFYKKFKDIIVSVDADRQNGISQLRRLQQVPDVILLDDGFQHRKVKAGLNILLTTYDDLYVNDIVLPTGNLREPRSGAKRAQIIMVTKCPIDMGESEKRVIVSRLKPLANQKVFFSTIKYSEMVHSSKESKPLMDFKKDIITLVTGIANPSSLLGYLDTYGFNYEHLNFKDHHTFKDSEIKSLNTKSLILTTEKDYTKLSNQIDASKLFYLPIETEISESAKFESIITKFINRY